MIFLHKELVQYSFSQLLQRGGQRAVPTITTHNSGSTRGTVAVGPNIKTDGFSMQLDVTDGSTPVGGGNFDFDANCDF